MLLILIHLFSILTRNIACFPNGNDSNVAFSHPDICNNSTFNNFPPCYCDSQCIRYGDCCLGVQFPIGESLILNTTKICRRNGHISYWTVTSCAQEWNEKSQTKVDIPVVDNDGTVYSNDRIAKCNDARASPMDIFVHLTADTCAVDSIMTLLEHSILDLFQAILTSNCSFAFVPNSFNKNMSIFPRYCIDWPERYISKYLSVQCKVYQRPLTVASVIYKNEYCFEDFIGHKITGRNWSFTNELYPVPFENDTHLRIHFQETFELSTLTNNICTDSNERNCNTRSIRNWKQKLEVILGSMLPIHDYHVKYSSIFFLHNFLKNDFNFTFEDSIYVYTLDINETTQECHPIFISFTVRNERSLSENQGKEALHFLENFKLDSFSSRIDFDNGSKSDINSIQVDCKFDEESEKKLPRKRRMVFKIQYLNSIMKHMGDIHTINAEKYCPRLIVESKERANKKYIDLFISKWQCIWQGQDHLVVLNASTFGYYMIMVGCISAITVIISFVTAAVSVKRFPKK